jgi:hypothetical protein
MRAASAAVTTRTTTKEALPVATIEQIREAMHVQPFQGFTLRLADGRSYSVRHPDFISVPELPRGRNLVVHDREGMHPIDILLVVEVQVPQPAEPPQDNGG